MSVFPHSGRIVQEEQEAATELYRELSSCAVDAELARLARSWNVERIEKIVGSFKHASIGVAKTRRKSFYALRAGSRPQTGHAYRIQLAFPRSRVMFWWQHPLALVLCKPSLAENELKDLLRAIPKGRIRELIWIQTVVPASGYRVECLATLDSQLISSLVAKGTHMAMLALAARYRLEQLNGNLRFELDAARGLWAMLPSVLRKSTHLLLAKDALILAVDFFLSWQPYADARIWQLSHTDETLGRAQALHLADELWGQSKRIPGDVKRARRERVSLDLLPPEVNAWSWWGTFFAPSSLYGCAHNML